MESETNENNIEAGFDGPRERSGTLNQTGIVRNLKQAESSDKSMTPSKKQARQVQFDVDQSEALRSGTVVIGDKELPGVLKKYNKSQSE